MPTPIKRDPADLERDWRARQQNVQWPDTLKNSRAVDVFLWRGSPNATPVQRAGAILIGAAYIAIGVGFISLGHENDEGWPLIVVGLGAFALGLKVFSNGLPRTK
jgi:hypothetical protein